MVQRIVYVINRMFSKSPRERAANPAVGEYAARHRASEIPCRPGGHRVYPALGVSGTDPAGEVVRRRPDVRVPLSTPRLPPGLGEMQPDIDAQLSNFFEETPQRDFARVMRGYDPHQVNEHLKQIDGELRQARENAQVTQRELADAHRQLQEQERPTYSGLGSRIEQLLRLAEEQATEILQEARTAANEFNATAKVEAAELRAAAENEAAELRANAKRETDDLRSSAEREADASSSSPRPDERTSSARSRSGPPRHRRRRERG